MNDRVYILRQSIVKLTQMLAGRGITVTQQGITAYVRSDATGRPVVVNLPYMPDNATEELIQAIQGFLDHEVAHILFTDFTVMPKCADEGVAQMLNLVEDTRIEREMAARFTGSAYNLERTGKFFLDKYTTPKITEAMAGGDNNMLIAVLTVPLVRAMSGQQIFKEFMKDHMAVVAPVYDKIKDLEKRIVACSSTQDAADIAVEIVKRLRDGEEPGKGEGKGKGKGGSGGASKKVAVSVSGKGGADEDGGETIKVKVKAKGKKEEKEEEEEGAGGKGAKGEKKEEEEKEKAEGEGKDKDEDKDESAGATEGEDTETDGDDADGASASAGEDEDGEEDAELAQGSGDDDEEHDVAACSGALWDAIDKETANDYDSALSKKITDSSAIAAAGSDYLVFTTDGDVIEPLHVGSGYRDPMLVELQDKTDHMVGPMQKDLERAISARSLSVWHAGKRSGRLHSANLSRLAVKTPSGYDDRVFRRREDATSKDVAVSLVVDCSGSMNGSKIHTATQSAYALASTLERIGIKSEVICFTTGRAAPRDHDVLREEQDKMGRRFSRYDTIYMPILKGFDERLTTEVKKRFGWLPNSSIMSANVDGESVMYAARRLLGRRESGKVMIVLSDGFPAASGDPGVLKAHLKKTVQDIAKAGVSVVGIGIESDAVQQFYPKNIVLHSVTELPGVVMKELRALIIK